MFYCLFLTIHKPRRNGLKYNNENSYLFKAVIEASVETKLEERTQQGLIEKVDNTAWNIFQYYCLLLTLTRNSKVFLLFRSYTLMKRVVFNTSIGKKTVLYFISNF